MNELLEKDQKISIVPKDFKYSNKGKVLQVMDKCFSIKMQQKPEGILPKKIMEFYSSTKNGTLYFSSTIVKIDEDIVVATIPRKHRFLQRRTFTRVKFTEEMEIKDNSKIYKITSVDLSAGGMKFKTKESLEIDKEYSLNLNLINNVINCNYQPIKIEKSDDSDDGFYTLAGRFKNLNRADRMNIVQFCIRKDIENKNR